MSPGQLASRLDDRFRLLTGGSRTAPPQHRTLRAVVDWSWELLSDAERTVLRRLAVFSGGASLEAAEQVCGGDAVERADVLELLSALTEKSLLLTEATARRATGCSTRSRSTPGTGSPRPGKRIWRARRTWPTSPGSPRAADPHLRRAEQLEWLATLEADHDNIAAGLRGALAAGEAPGGMRLAAAAGWYWWLGAHKAEGLELITAAAGTPGEVSDEIRAMVYALGVMFMTDGPGDQYQAEEWIHKAYRFTQRSKGGSPLLALVAPLERMLQEPQAFMHAFEPLLTADDPWLRALGRLHLGKARIILGQEEREADAYLEAALAEFRALGERWGIQFALTELADRIATRGDFAGACEHLDQAIAVVTELGAVEDVIRMRARQAQLYWLLGDEESSAAAMAEAQRHAERVVWPSALAALALARAELARWTGDTEQAARQLDVATAMLGDEAELAQIRALTHDLLGYLADGLDEAREHRARGTPGRVGGGVCAPGRAGAHRDRGPGAAGRAVRAGRCSCWRRVRASAGWRTGNSRTWPASSRPRGVASAKRGSPRRRWRGRRPAGRAGPSYARLLNVARDHTYPTRAIPAHQPRAAAA